MKVAKTSKDDQKSAHPGLIICDTNVVVMMAIFKKSIMFAADYSFGSIEIHESVIDELKRWITAKGAKYRKFGEPLIRDFINESQKHSGRLVAIPHDQLQNQKIYLDRIEGQISTDRKGSATSDVDKLLLALAMKNNAKLATQERTLGALASRVLSKGSLVRFEDLVVDLIDSKMIKKDDVETGLYSLEHYQEWLSAEAKSAIKDALDRQV